MRRIALADAAFLYAEKRQTPMHIGGLHLFTLPEGVDEPAFLSELMNALRVEEELRRPFGEYVTTGHAGPLGPMYWEKDRRFDVDYHVRQTALPKPGRFRELFILISRLQGQLLDRNRPLWETYLIEGLQNRQFALYMKMHHAAIDGMGAMHMTNAMYSTRQSEKALRSPLSYAAYEEYKASQDIPKPARVIPRTRELRNVSEVLREQFNTTANLFSAFRRFGSAFFGGGEGLAVPWHHIPRTSINTRVTGARRFVAQSWDFGRIRAVCKAVDGTVNDVVLAMCSGALRRYMISQGELPQYSLKAMTPVSLRAKGDLDSANAVGLMVADLATDLNDPEQRLKRIQASMTAGKSLVNSLSRREAMLFMQITQAPALLTTLLGLTSQFPAFSTVISNVPGPAQQLYWNGARLDGMYPASIVFDGFAVNFTLVSYNNELHFGITACRRSMPGVQRLIEYLDEALVELEVMAGLATAPTSTRSKAKSRARPKAKAKRAATKTTRAKTAAPKKAATKKPATKKATTKKAATKKAPVKPKAKKTAPAARKAKAGPAKAKARARPKQAAKT